MTQPDLMRQPLQAEMEQALDQDELRLDYQPVVDITAGEVCGVEALIRWQHPVGGLLHPEDFIPALAQTPAVAAVTRWALRRACADAARWPDWTVSVNVTARDVAVPSFAGDVLDVLEEAGVECERLIVELTERALVQDLDRAAAALQHLRDCGVGVALDDFGTGYSSMLYLRDLPITSVKIDREFIRDLRPSGDNQAIVGSLLTLARRVGLNVVAEGVENKTQAGLLARMGCPQGQGYFWGDPAPADDMVRIYKDGLARGFRGGSRRRERDRAPDPQVASHAQQLLSDGASLHTIAAALNAAGHRNSRGDRWHSASVARLITETLSSNP